MPQRKAALKKLGADKKRHLRNIKIKKSLKTSLKKFLTLLKDNKKEELWLTLKEAFSKLDKAASKGVIHKNTAQRKKSRLHKKFLQITLTPSGKA
ncbi:MAG: 30S ribosomal protein S20 [Candidatus Omnitrophota bacterium]